ncbi:YfiR family protein [Opitutus terrae]|uniref:Putative transmembrane protein n=1 Tax=Opitutus terrae (strain DSM 11246 / JCM 15787 / PB90-1) TaxID=452637 RepID=B1ZYC2_OPITP|nr:YfiR family protein [Opitutus terrae]ACB77020.1 putative transmembrane protein [Opitutus terrae PB90-1]
MASISALPRPGLPLLCGLIFRILASLCGSVLLGRGQVAAAVEAPPEFQVKAVFLSNFARFVEWPRDVAAQADEVVIGVLGADPFGLYLDEVLRGQKVNGHALVVKRYGSVAEIDRCHVLFMSGSEGERAEPILQALRTRPILTVCDTNAFARHGAMIHLVMDQQRVRLRINLDAARQAGLVISSKLLRTAEIVTDSEGMR